MSLEDDMKLFAPALTPGETALREQFLQEYIKDFDDVAAAMRCGFMHAFAKEYGPKFLQEPYVQWRLAELKTATPLDEAKQAEADRQMILAGLRQTAQNGPYQTRVAAMKTMAGILGIDKAPEPIRDIAAELSDAFEKLADKLPS
jgi:hypothetical protein